MGFPEISKKLPFQKTSNSRECFRDRAGLTLRKSIDFLGESHPNRIHFEGEPKRNESLEFRRAGNVYFDKFVNEYHVGVVHS